MKHKIVIYTSSHLRTTPKTVCIANAISKALGDLGIEHRELNNTNDYWCRDYMPVLLSDDGVYAKYKYNPDYLKDYITKQKYITEQDVACRDLTICTPTDLGIVFDGGNYVRCDDKVIMTDKIFMENPEWKPLDLLSHLTEKLSAEIILLPWDMYDFCGHADGMVASLGGNKILLNNCWKNKDKEFHKRLTKILEPHFDIVEPVYNCKEDKDSWCYLNYLQLPNAILLPVLSKNADCDNDIAAIETFSRLFPLLKIIPIYSRPLIGDGGARPGPHSNVRGTLITIDDDEKIKQAGRNIPNLTFLSYNRLNAHDLYYGRKVIVLESAVANLSKFYDEEKEAK